MRTLRYFPVLRGFTEGKPTKLFDKNARAEVCVIAFFVHWAFHSRYITAGLFVALYA